MNYIKGDRVIIMAGAHKAEHATVFRSEKPGIDGCMCGQGCEESYVLVPHGFAFNELVYCATEFEAI